jgi:hypothetical protein
MNVSVVTSTSFSFANCSTLSKPLQSRTMLTSSSKSLTIYWPIHIIPTPFPTPPVLSMAFEMIFAPLS